MILEKLASAIRNDIVSGLRGYHSNMSLNLKQLEDDIVDTRLQLIKEYSLKGILPVKDLSLSIKCINVNCGNLERCGCLKDTSIPLTKALHFEIPQIVGDFGDQSIQYIGGIDGMSPFIFYTSPSQLKLHKYKKRGKDKPYVWIDTSPNKNGLLDCFVFNAPLLKKISVTGIFKDPRQLEEFGCCEAIADDNLNFINAEVKQRVTEQKIKYYRQLATPLTSNDQTYNAG